MTNMHMNLTWHRGSEPPKTSGVYYMISEASQGIVTVNYSARHGLFNARDDETEVEARETAIRAAWWAKLPSWMTYCGSPGGEG